MSPMALHSASIGSGRDSAQVGLEFGEGHFDRIEIGTVGRQEEEPGAALPEDGPRLLRSRGWPGCRG